MVVSATITMLLIMTFRIPGGALGALYAFLISRDNLRSTFRSGLAIGVSYQLGVCFVLLGADVFADQQSARIAWFAASMFVTFFGLRTLRHSDVASGFAVLIVNALPIWQLPATAEYRVELTLWQTLAVAIGTVVTITVEVVFRAFYPKDEVRQGICERLDAVCVVIEDYAQGQVPSRESQDKLDQYSMVGTSGLRRLLAKSRYRDVGLDELATTIALVGRIVDLGSGLVKVQGLFPRADREQLDTLTSLLRKIIQSLEEFGEESRPPFGSHAVPDTSSFGIFQLIEIERTASLIGQVMAGGDLASTPIKAWKSVDPGVEPDAGTRRPAILPSDAFIPDAFRNREHVMWALRGSLAATMCYLTYEILDWRGIATSVTTCVITALSTVGDSRQKQILRITGAIAGGIVLGIGSQIFILTYIDSIASFTILFACVTAIGAWFATSSSRLSYFGVQLALAFYLVNLQEFAIQTSLTVPRDRVVGILLGLFMMWLIFDRLGNARASTEMISAFCANLRGVAALLEQTDIEDLSFAIAHVSALRQQIRQNFEKANSQADAVPFEFSLSRRRRMAVRSLIRSWQPRLRSIYFLELACLQHRLFEIGDPLPREFWVAVGKVNDSYAAVLRDTSSHLEGVNIAKPHLEKLDIELRHLNETVRTAALFPDGRIRAQGITHLLQCTRDQLAELSQQILGLPPGNDLAMDGEPESIQERQRDNPTARK